MGLKVKRHIREIQRRIRPMLSAAKSRRSVRLLRYAEWKHVGPYNKLGEACAALKKAVEAMGFRLSGPLVEVYGHWTDDESKLETTILLSIN